MTDNINDYIRIPYNEFCKYLIEKNDNTIFNDCIDSDGTILLTWTYSHTKQQQFIKWRPVYCGSDTKMYSTNGAFNNKWWFDKQFGQQAFETRFGMPLPIW